MIALDAAEVALVGRALEDVDGDVGVGPAVAGRQRDVVGGGEAHLHREAEQQAGVVHEGPHPVAAPRRTPPAGSRTPSRRTARAGGWRRPGRCGRRTPGGPTPAAPGPAAASTAAGAGPTRQSGAEGVVLHRDLVPPLLPPRAGRQRVGGAVVALGEGPAGVRHGVAARLKTVHEALALSGLMAIVLHGLLLLPDPFLHPGLVGITIPFALPADPAGVAAGIVAGWLAAIITLSFYVRSWIGARAWRRLHRWTFAVSTCSASRTRSPRAPTPAPPGSWRC